MMSYAKGLGLWIVAVTLCGIAPASSWAGTIVTPPLEMNIIGGLYDLNLGETGYLNRGECLVLNDDDEAIDVTVEIFDSEANLRVSYDLNVPAHAVRLVAAYTTLGGVYNLVNRGFCRVSGKFKKKTTRVTLLQCFGDYVAQPNPAGCQGAVSSH